MKLMLVHRSHFDHGFKPQNAVEAALSRVSKITIVSRAPNPHRLDPYAVRVQTDAGNGNTRRVDRARARSQLHRSA